jgi:hypothetical protein
VPNLHQLTAGGSLIPEIEEIFHGHPAGYDHRFRVRRPEKPRDLHRTDNRAIQTDDLPFMVVAYGLTVDSKEVPETFTPAQIGPAYRPTRTASIGKICDGKEDGVW